MNLLSSFEQYINKENLFPANGRLLLAVSGGVDSVVLCELCLRAGYQVEIAHCNFKLRKEESNADESFVQELAKKYEVPFFVKQFETEEYAQEHKISIQVAARELRYEWFNILIEENKPGPAEKPSAPRYIVTAHHADDNIETILMNFFKGSGINGLKGIVPKQKNIVRPLLFASKENLLAFANENNLAYREDSSNSSDKYTRNYFRNQLLPGLQKVFPQVKENLLDNAQRFREINSIYNVAIESIKKRLVSFKGNEMHLPVLKLLKTASLQSVLFEIIKDVGFTARQAHEVVKLLNSESGKYIDSQTHRILLNRKWLIISPLNDMETSHFLIEENDTDSIFPAGKLLIQKNSGFLKPGTDDNIAQVNATAVVFPLILRKWKQGDYFYPLGMQHKKKLSRFFIDQKLSLNRKQQVWVIESQQKIIWVVGQRIDDRFKIKNGSENNIRFSFLPSK
ncbi:MAG: tRNA lysidine(34) synthetase TilS [Ferruginibacter sp.]